MFILRSSRKGDASGMRVALAVAVGAVLVAAGAALYLRHGHHHATATTASTPPAMPKPIPGYLLIADRGNNRMLLVDNAKRVLWRYPKPGQGLSFPFHFDDDTFFGPNLKT